MACAYGAMPAAWRAGRAGLKAAHVHRAPRTGGAAAAPHQHRAAATPPAGAGALSIAGEQQRAASARALINTPDLILADEMTGNLDEDTSDEIINFFLKFIESNNISLLYVTHNQKYADMAKNKYEFRFSTRFRPQVI